MEHEQPINAYVCQYCKGSFDKLENLSKHVQKIHTVCSSGKENRICPLCGTQCIKIEGYRNHLRHIHGHNEEGQVVIFKSFNDFLVWKNELEKRNYCKYVMRDPPKKLPSNDKIHIYRCDSSVGSMKEKRSGVAVKESCPAVITAIESAKTKGVKIEHWNSHVGHIIPVEEDELDAAIGSLGTTEIVLTTDQRYQYEGQSADGNIFFITETNDASLSETFVKEVPKRASNLFQNTKSKVSESFSKPASQKFSYKKDPTKKSGSFNYSLASVACMKPSAKKKLVVPPAVATTSSAEDSVSTSITNSDVLFSAPITSVTDSEVELATESISDIIDVDISSNTETPVEQTEKGTPTSLASPSKGVSIVNSGAITNQTFEFINDGSLSGQVVLLNSLPGQNVNQNVLLSPDHKFISIGPPISVGTSKKGKASKKSQKNNAASQIIVIPSTSEKENAASNQSILNITQNPITVNSVLRSPLPSTSEKENVSSVQNILNLSQNSIPISSIAKSPGPSILKKAKKSVQKSSKKVALPAGKNIKLAAKNTISGPKKTMSTELKLQLGVNPSLDVSVVDAAKPTVSASNNYAENVKVVNSVTSIQGTTTMNSSSNAQNSVPSNISNIQPVNPVLLNSFPPGQTFMSINNNLIPIGTPASPLLPSNLSSGFVLTSPVPPSPITRPNTYIRPATRPLVSPVPRPRTYSRLASRPPVTSSNPPVGSVDKNTPQKQTSVGTTAPHTSTVPLLLIPSSGSPISSSVPFSSSFVASSVNSTLSSSIRPNQPIISSSLFSGPGCSVLPRPLISNTSGSIIQLPPGAQLIPSSNIPVSFSSNNGQQISRPLLQNVPLLTTAGQQIPRALLQNIAFPAPVIGQPGIAPRAIISTTVSNAIQVQKVQLPFSKSIAPSSSVTHGSTANVNTTLSESTKVSSVVLNTEPISSAPTINIPPLASIASHKPGSVIFESQGDVYMLEPVDENPQVSNNTTSKNGPTKMSIAVPNGNGNTRTNKSDEAKESAFEGNNLNSSSLQKEKAAGGQNTLDARVDGKVQSLSPRKNSDVKNGVQIKSVVQEKRHLKDDDVEILKKVKYYQMEMKYLSSQAECKRLKLELARAQMKNKEITKKNTDLLSGELSMKEKTVENALHIDVASDKHNLGMKQIYSVDNVTENVAMDVDDTSHEVNCKTTENHIASVQATNIVSSNQCDVDSSDSNHSGDVSTESGDSNCGDVSPVDSEDSNHSDNSPANSGDSNNNAVADKSSKENQRKDSMYNKNSNNNFEDMSCDIESNEESNLETQKKACNTLNEKFKNINTLEDKSQNFNLYDSNEKLKDSNKSPSINKSAENQDNDLMDFSEIEENFKDATEDNQTVNDSEIEDIFKVQGSADKQIHPSNTEKSVQNNNLENTMHLTEHNVFGQQKVGNKEHSIDLNESNNTSLGSKKTKPSHAKSQFQETLKELEFQYGNDESSDIYTMVRTSVLRSLYDDLKILCEENKKLYEKLQHRSQEESCETD